VPTEVAVEAAAVVAEDTTEVLCWDVLCWDVSVNMLLPDIGVEVFCADVDMDTSSVL
jgi:hypothetical protein